MEQINDRQIKKTYDELFNKENSFQLVTNELSIYFKRKSFLPNHATNWILPIRLIQQTDHVASEV